MASASSSDGRRPDSRAHTDTPPSHERAYTSKFTDTTLSNSETPLENRPRISYPLARRPERTPEAHPQLGRHHAPTSPSSAATLKPAPAAARLSLLPAPITRRRTARDFAPPDVPTESGEGVMRHSAREPHGYFATTPAACPEHARDDTNESYDERP